ncbi:winged helix-turn-helix domain-containing protein [Streptomyces jumonjinensis]|uniref:winged helix-turn-helix domain-containing protein n=1 Tax=Streptomyces jumonjinensis TaxID=1945 RepID=UPI00379B8222
MANSLPFSAVSAVSAVPGGPAAARPAAGVSTARRLRAVERDEVVPPVRLAQVAELLPPGATWLPAPQHTVPSLPGRPPMVGYLVLVPADQHPPAAAPAPQPTAPAAVGGTGPVRIDQAERIAVVNGRALDLTYLEFELLTHLVTHPHRVHTRDQLVTTVWGYGHVGDGRTVDVHVARLRRKLGAEHRHTIQTVRRVGYKYTP